MSRNLDFFNHITSDIHKALQKTRSTLALVFAPNGLRDEEIQYELIARRDMNMNESGISSLIDKLEQDLAGQLDGHFTYLSSITRPIL